jgi:hypothetical protein
MWQSEGNEKHDSSGEHCQIVECGRWPIPRNAFSFPESTQTEAVGVSFLSSRQSRNNQLARFLECGDSSPLFFVCQAALEKRKNKCKAAINRRTPKAHMSVCGKKKGSSCNG